MKNCYLVRGCLALLLAPQWPAFAQTSPTELEKDRAIERPRTISMNHITYKGKSALHLADLTPEGSTTIVPLKIVGFRNGTISADIAGQPRRGAPEYARGFVGIAFRVAGEKRYEAFYIRPTNGRSEDQFRRNHITQYISLPDFDWQRLRFEKPGVYESYANVAPGEWSRVRIVVQGQTARLYVNGEEQPALIVNDLKLGSDGSGDVALWVGPHTDAHFANVTVVRSR